MDRRTFLSLGMSAAALAARGTGMFSPQEMSVKAILFDAFSIFDPGTIVMQAKRLFPDQGERLADLWRTRQFEYSWLCTLMGRYTDFPGIISESLDYSAQLLKLTVSRDQHRQLVEGYLAMPIWSEASEVLEKLKSRGYRIGILSNFTTEMLQSNVSRNDIAGYFEHLVSVDAIRRYKPDPLAYQLGIDTFHLLKEEILFVPSAGWDAAGAVSFGYKTFWINRTRQPAERIIAAPDFEGRDLMDLIKFI